MTAALLSLDATLKRLELGERLVRRNPMYYPSVQRQFAALQEMSLDERVEWTRDRLSKILAAARRTGYGKRVDAPSAIERWPILHKESVRGDPRAFHAGGTLFTSRAATGGTTGMPLELIRSPESVVAEQVCLDRMMLSLGVQPGSARIAVLRADTIKDPSDLAPPYWVYALGGRRLIFSANHLSATTLPHYVQELERFQPELLWVYPTALESFCRLLARAGLTVKVPGVLSSSEMLHAPVWQLAQSTLRCKIVDYYGQAERVAFAHASTADAYYFLPGYAHVELIRRSDEGGESLYEVVGTSLWNTAMPLVRYGTGDLIRVPRRYRARELLEVTHGLRPFLGLVGRSHDVLLAPDGSGVLTGMNHLPRSVGHLLRLQVVQQAADHVVLRALVAPGFSDENHDQLLQNARRKIPNSARVDIELVDELRRTARGKTPYIIHSPQVIERLRAVGFETEPRR